MDNVDREDLIKDVAMAVTAAASQKELSQCYFEDQYGYLDGLNYDEIIELADIYLQEFNIENYRKE